MNASASPTLARTRSDPARSGAPSPDYYAALDVALRRLRADPNDGEAALSALRAYTALGLIEPAIELLTDGASPLASLAEFRPVRDQLSAMPSGRIPPATVRPRFEANLRSLLAAHPHLRRHDEALRRAAGELGLYRAVDGNPFASTGGPGLRRRWLPGLCDTKRLVAGLRLPHDPDRLFCAPYLVARDHLGALLSRVHDGTRRMFLTFTPRLYLLEPDPRSLAATLCAVETAEALCDARVTVLIGADCIETLVSLLEAHPERAVPHYVVQSPFPDPGFHERLLAALRSVTAERDRRGHATIRSLRRHYDGLKADHWRGRFDPDRTARLRVLGLTSRFTTVLQYAMRDLNAAFERRGHAFRLLIETSDHDLLPPVRIAEAIEDFHPDLIVVIDHLRQEYAQVIPANVPYVCWIQDRMPHLFKKEAGRGVGPMEFVIGHGFPECLTEFDYPAERFFPCVIPTNPDRLTDPRERSEDLEPFRCDVMYATHAAESPEQLHAHHRRQFHGPARAFVDAAWETLRAVVRDPSFCGDYDYDALIARVETQTGIAIDDPAARGDMAGLLRFIAHQSLREATIRAAARWAEDTGGRFFLYGRGWDRRPEFAPFARGPVEHGRPLGRAFRAAKISLHAGCNAALHQRVLDGLCAGGFFLIQAKPSDAAHALNRALYQYVRQNNLEPPFRLRPADLPEPFAGAYRRFLLIRGNDPDQGVLATREMWLNVRAECEWGCLPRASAVWPRFDAVVYRGIDHLPDRIEHYLRHEALRRELADEMRRAVLEHFTYDALVGSVLRLVGRTLGPKRLAGGSSEP